MRFYKQPHEFYCGIDLHTKKMYCCLIDAAGDKLVHRNIDTRGDRFLNLVEPYRDGLVVGTESVFAVSEIKTRGSRQIRCLPYWHSQG